MVKQLMTLKASATAAALALAFFAAPASASTLYATGVTWTNNGTVGAGRDNPNAALSAPDGDFLSLGLGGTADFTFGRTFTGPGVVFEITLGNRETYNESANIFAGFAGDESTFTQVGSVDNNSSGGISFSFNGVFDTLRLVDTSESVQGRDGYDVDAIGVYVPLPASAPMLLAGLAGMAWLRRRKTNSA